MVVCLLGFLGLLGCCCFLVVCGCFRLFFLGGGLGVIFGVFGFFTIQIAVEWGEMNFVSNGACYIFRFLISELTGSVLTYPVPHKNMS